VVDDITAVVIFMEPLMAYSHALEMAAKSSSRH
jgi:hypothetical protein